MKQARFPQKILKLYLLDDISVWMGVITCWASLQPWPMWFNQYAQCFIYILFATTRFISWGGKISWASTVAFVSTIGLAFIYSQLFYTPIKGSIYAVLMTILPILTFLTFDWKEKRIFLKRLINTFSIIGLFSLVAFLLHFFVDLPYVLVKHPNSYYPLFKNYFVFVINSYGELDWFTRFSSIYTEPGHLGMVSAILLYINGYSLKKWQNIVMTICLIWSLSLAGYVLYVIGLILYVIVNSRNIIVTITKIMCTASVVIVVGIGLYSPQNDDVVSVLILSRLEIDDNKGIAGNNRNSIRFEKYYNKFLDSSDKWIGIGREKSGVLFGGTGNSSYKNYVLSNGIIGVSAIIFLMIIFLFCFPSRKGLGLMILLMASFIQRPYFLWPIESLPYLAALSNWYIGIKGCNHYEIIKKKDKNSIFDF